MNQRAYLICVAVSCALVSTATAEILPQKGTFTSYFFTDRWGQGVFDIFFVAPDLTPNLAEKSWRPIAVTSNDIRQPCNPGAAMIHQIENVARLDDPPLRITLALDEKSIRFGGETTLHVTVANASDRPHKLYHRDLLLRTTVHTRGTHPDHVVERDEIHDCFKNVYGFGLPKRIIRATHSHALFKAAGAIQMRRGAPILLIEKDGTAKPAGVYDEDHPIIAGNESLKFVYTIGPGWLLNEYELQVQYRPREKCSVPYILSPPVSFDVIDTD